MRTVSRVIFISFILACLFTITTAFNTMLGLSEVSGASIKEAAHIEVVEGDTLWTIAETYASEDMDIRDAIDIIQEANCISSQIHPGDILVIPGEIRQE